MKEQFYLEIRENWKKIRQMEEGKSEEEKEAARACILDVLQHLFYFTQFAKNEEVLSIENELDGIEIKEQYEKDMLMSVVNGLDISSLEELYMLQYFSEELNPYAALCYLYFLWGVLTLCRGRYVGSLKSQFCTLIPQEMKDACRKIPVKFEEERSEELQEEIDFEFPKRTESVAKKGHEIVDAEIRKALIHQMCEVDNPFKHGDAGYIQMRAVEILFGQIGDEGICKLVVEFDNNEWATAMTGMNGKTRRLLFSNMPNEEAYKVAEFYEQIRLPDRSMTVYRLKSLLEAIKRLVEEGVITLDKRFFNLFEYI